MSVKIKTDKTKAMVREVMQLTRARVLVGVPGDAEPHLGSGSSGENERKPETTGAPPPPINNAALAFIHNGGSPQNNIPARPFMEPGVKAVQDQLADEAIKGARAALDGSKGAGYKALTRMGLLAQAAIRKKITDGPFEALADRTIEARKRRGRKGTKPLIDTGQLRNSINFVIRSKMG
jgi:phage gpG-like protein